MAKKDNDLELNAWRLQYPSTTVSWNLIGDPAYTQQFIGEAKNILYQVKNRMNTAVPKLKSFQDIRRSTDGTVIIVRSIYGQDFIDIDSTKAITGGALKQKCTITFINIPLYVPPMKNPGEIKAGEVEGVDYFKTYYSVDISKCSKCGEPSWEFLFKYLQSSPLDPLPKPPLPISTRIEWPIEPLHHQDFDADGLLLHDDVTDHTIYSLSPPAWGEVVSHGTDSEGAYIIWKAYTESGTGVPYSRTGLAIMRLVARIRNEKGEEICAQNERIEVDCCIKDDALRPVEIWWEDFGTCQPFIMYQGVLYNAICKMETSIPMVGTAGLIWYACTHPYQPFYAIPEILGSCLPVKWELTGPIAFLGSNKNDDLIFIRCLEGATECHAIASITLTDRCGNQYVIQTKPCCAEAEPLSMNYTSLQMSCSGQQEFYATGGCGPYKWSCGAGTITEAGLYTAPATNPNCGNDTVTVTDCCGSSAECKIAINCGTGHAYKTCEEVICETDPSVLGYLIIDTYECDGTLSDHICAFYWGGMEWHECDCGNCCGHYLPDGGCAFVVGGPLVDIRSEAQKEAGCCPLALA